ncbi:MAG: putative metalloprotease CJM1_0395 family protein, partial [Pseudomonadota bacterium]
MLAPNQATSAALPLIAQQVKTDPSKPNEGLANPRKVDPSRPAQASSPDPTRLPEPALVQERAATGPVNGETEADPLARLNATGIGEAGTRNLIAGDDAQQEPSDPSAETVDPVTGLTDAEMELVRNLQARDREVRDHEQAHARVGGRFASEPSYDTQVGPDGRNYAIGGSVQIDISPVKDDPQATIA